MVSRGTSNPTAAKVNVSRPRILFLQTLKPQKHLEVAVRQAIGVSAVRVVTPGSRLITAIIYTVVAVVWLVLISCLVPLYYKTLARQFAFVVTATICFAILWLFILIKIRMILLLRDASKKADIMFEAFHPNIIVACNYGSVIALQMHSPAVPLILLSPSQDVYARELCLSTTRHRLDKFPYVLACHGAADNTIPFDDTIRLCNTISDDRCHLISLDSDDPSLEGVITVDEMRDLILYTFHEGWITALTLGTQNRKKKLVVDVSLLSLPDIVSLLSLPDIVSFSTVALQRLQASSGPLRAVTELSFGDNILHALVRGHSISDESRTSGASENFTTKEDVEKPEEEDVEKPEKSEDVEKPEKSEDVLINMHVL